MKHHRLHNSLPPIFALAFFALASFALPSPAESAPRLLVEIGERISASFGKRAAGRGGPILDPTLIAREGRQATAGHLPLPAATGTAIRHGDGLMLLESHVPGMGEKAVARFSGPGELERLAALPTEQARTVIAYAGRAKDAKAASTLLEAVEQTGGRVLQRITPGQILAGGLGTSAVLAASKLSSAAATSPELLIETAAETLRPVSVATAVGIGGALLLLGLAFAARWAGPGLVRGLHQKSEESPPRDSPARPRDQSAPAEVPSE